MNLSDLEKQLQELQQIDASTLTPEQLQELIDKLASITNIGEEMLYNDVLESEENEDDDFDYEDYLLDINDIDNNENESYDENNT